MSRDGKLRIPDLPNMEKKYRDRWSLWQEEWARYKSASVSDEEEQLAGDLGSPETGLRIASTGDGKDVTDWKINKLIWGRHGFGKDEIGNDERAKKTKDTLTTTTWRETMRGETTMGKIPKRTDKKPVREEMNRYETKTKGSNNQLMKWENTKENTNDGRFRRGETWTRGRKMTDERKTTSRYKTRGKKEGTAKKRNSVRERSSAIEGNAGNKGQPTDTSKDKMLMIMAIISLIICIVASVITFLVTRGERTVPMSVM